MILFEVFVFMVGDVFFLFSYKKFGALLLVVGVELIVLIVTALVLTL